MALKRDVNFSATGVRQGEPIGGILTEAASSITANTWYRLCPHGNTGATVSTNRKQLNLGTPRGDVRRSTFQGWKIKILNGGYNPTGFVHVLDVLSMDDSGIAELKYEPDHWDNLPSQLDWVLYPRLDFPLSITLESASLTGTGTSSGDLEIGITTEETINPTQGNIRRLDILRNGSTSNTTTINTDQIDKIFYRYLYTAATGNHTLIWRESGRQGTY